MTRLFRRNARKKLQVGILFSVGAFVFIVVSIRSLRSPYSVGGRRSLSAPNPSPDSGAPLPWSEYNFVDVTDRPDPSKETAIFWHIPKSGGTTAKRLYECQGFTLANRLGANPRFGHDQDKKIVVFSPFPNEPHMKFVNVDTTSQDGILRAAKLGLVASRKADMIFTSDIYFAGQHLFDRDHKGRIYAFFRNPVDRSVSKFYYLQTATWERTYRPEWVGMSIVEWATKHNADENFLVKKILGKKLKETIDLGDLMVAKDIVRRHFIVGLMNDMEESIRRFNIFLGVDFDDECRKEYFGSRIPGARHLAANEGGNTPGAVDNMNSNPHPKVEAGSPEYNILASRNSFDMVLYDYITLLYEEQRRLIYSYTTSCSLGLGQAC